MDKDKIYLLRLNCKDQVGIVSKISTLLANKNCNIIESKQFTDQDTNSFFIRQSFQLPNELSIETINKEFKNLSNILNANYEIRHIHKTLKTLILASKFDHCLIELINKTKNKNLNLSIEAVISNHNDLKKISKLENLPFHHFPIDNDKLKQEKRIIEFIDEKKIDIIILARYMQILSKNFYETKVNYIHMNHCEVRFQSSFGSRILSERATEPEVVKSQLASCTIPETSNFWITSLYFTFGTTVTKSFSNVLALNKAAAMYLPANSPAYVLVTEGSAKF